MNVFVLSSRTGYGDDGHHGPKVPIGIFETEALAQKYVDEATPGIPDPRIDEWGVHCSLTEVRDRLFRIAALIDPEAPAIFSPEHIAGEVRRCADELWLHINPQIELAAPLREATGVVSVGLCEAALTLDGSHSSAALHRESPGCKNWRPSR